MTSEGPKSSYKVEKWDFWDSINRPKTVLAPMVDQSELPFRMLCRKYGADLCYTPMLHSRLFSEQPKYRRDYFTTCDEEKPVIAQFCGDNPETMLKAAQFIQDKVSAVDINCGCPQGIAKKGHYGAYLLSERDLVCEIVSRLHKGLDKVPVTLKMRKVDQGDMQETVNFVKAVQASGVSVLAFHARTKEQKGQFTGKANWDYTSIVRKYCDVPLIANGGIEFLEDCDACLKYTGADAVMSSEAILENPALFYKESEKPKVDDLMVEYLDLVDKYPVPASQVKAHLFHSLYSGLQVHVDLRSRLSQTNKMEDFRAIVEDMRERRKDVVAGEDLGWYRRYRKRDAEREEGNEAGKEGEKENARSREQKEEEEEGKSKRVKTEDVE